MDRLSTPRGTSGYDTGSDMWNDTVLSHGIDEAVVICKNYLDIQLKRERTDNEKLFCRELFSAVYEDTAGTVNPNKLIYPYPSEEAEKCGETSCYYISRRVNQECVLAIDDAISESNYRLNSYNIENAVWKIVLEYGFNRVKAVLSYHIQYHEYDARYSRSNKDWSRSFSLPSKAFDSTRLNAHACLIDRFTECVRNLYAELNAERFALPGHEEYGEFVHGYETIRAVMINEDHCYAIGYNQNAVSPYVCWRFYTRDGERSYDWGIYGDEQDAINAYNARVFVALN